MNYLKRAWLSVSRRKGKSFLLFGLIFIIANVIAGAISIQQGAQNVEKKIKSSMGALATITVDHEALSKEANQTGEYKIDQYITLDTIKKVGASPYVKYYDYNLTTSLGSEAITHYLPETLKEEQEKGGYVDEMGKYYSFQLKGVNYHNILDIEEKKINLVAGRVLTEEEVTSGKPVGIISKKLADQNQLKVGDTALVSSFKIDHESSSTTPTATKITDYAIEIVGIYDIPTKPAEGQSDKGGQSGQFSDKMGRAYQELMTINTIYVPNQLVEGVIAEQMSLYASEAQGEIPKMDELYQPVFVLKQPEDAVKFKEENQAYMPKFFVIKASSDEYDVIAAPVQSITKMAGYVLLVAIVAAVLIITLVVLLFLRDRKHELGIYLSFGEKRGRVFSQILLEVLLIAFAAVTISVVTGNLIAKGLSGNLIQQQAERQSSNNSGSVIVGNELSSLGGNQFTTDDVISAYEVNLTPVYILLMYTVSIGTVLVATLLPLAYILRLNPKKIMM